MRISDWSSDVCSSDLVQVAGARAAPGRRNRPAQGRYDSEHQGGAVTLPSRLREGHGTIALIDYGAGNLRSVPNALVAAGSAGVAVTADPDVVAQATRIVLHGAGAFAAATNRPRPGPWPTGRP